jgi:ABC-2 type transport system permease protein
MNDRMHENLGAARTVWLVARREFGTRVRSRRMLAATVSVAVLLVAFVALQAFVFDQAKPLRIGLAGQAISLQQGLPQQMSALGVSVVVHPLDTVDEGLSQVRHGQLDVVVYGARSALHVTVDNQLDPRLRATLNGQVRQQILDAQLAQLGARPDDVLAKVDQAQISVTQLNAHDPNVGERTVVGVLTALLLAWSLLLFGAVAARRVAEDAARGTAEALLPVLRPARLLAGNLGGAGLAGLVHTAALGVLGVVVAMLFGVSTVPSALFIALAAGLVGFVLGFGVYGLLAAGFAAMSGGPRDRRRTLVGLGVLVCCVLVVSLVLVTADPGGSATAVLSVLPPFAPVLMPARLAVGFGAGWQVLLAVALTLVAVAGLAWFAGRVYPRSLLPA